jgi:hypothetical protein
MASKTLVFLVGPPAVGKMTVGQELQRRTGLPLFHNHLSIEAVLPVFGFGQPGFNRLVTMLRREVFAEVARSELPGLIFTFVWAFNAPDELAYVKDLVSAFDGEGCRTVFVELWADLETRLERNETENRLAEKPSKRDVDRSRSHLVQAESEWQFRPEGDFPLEPHLFIDNTSLTPEEAANRIIDHFDLPTSGPS